MKFAATNPEATHSVRIIVGHADYRVTATYVITNSTRTLHCGISKSAAWSAAKAAQGYEITVQGLDGSRRRVA